METFWKTIIWRQFGAAIDMLENAIRACPENLWADRSRKPEYWYLAYHTLFWLDYYSSESFDRFTPPAPFTLGELDPAGVLPERVYAKSELLTYLEHGRQKARAVVDSLTDESAARPRRFAGMDSNELDLVLYNQRHVQHHAAQLYLILRQTIDSTPGWVGQSKRPLSGDWW